MNFFNEIDKVSYKKETTEPIVLIEYIKFKDENKKEKYLLFKFRNNLNQIASSIKFEIKQFDSSDNLIQKTVFSYDNFKAKAQEIFVPTAKLIVNYETDYIEVKLLQASFESVWWNGEELLPICLTKERFEDEYTCKKETKADVTNKAKRSNAEVVKGARKTKYKDVTKSNRPKLPKIFTAFLTLAFISVLVLCIFRLKNESKYVHDLTFEYEIVDKDEIKIINYLGEGINVTIPSKFMKYDVVSIEKEAFKDSNIRKLTFKEGSINIKINAFEGCSMLTEIADPNGCVKNVSANAFKDCYNLKTVVMPDATISAEAFNNCKEVIELTVKDFVQGSIASVFNVAVSLNSLNIKQQVINKSFFDNVASVYYLELSGSTYVEIDAFDNIALKKLKIGSSASVNPNCLAKFGSLDVELNLANEFKRDDYLAVNSKLNITTWSSVE